MSHTVSGTVEAVLISPPGSDIEAQRLESVEVTFEGFAGDRHSGLLYNTGSRTPHYKRGTQIRNSRQISIVSVEELHAVADLLGLPSITPEALGANLLITGIPALTLLPPTTRLFFPDGTVLVVEGENHPCATAGAAVQACYPDVEGVTTRFPKAALQRRGIVAWVEHPGHITPGDSVRAAIPDQVIYEHA